MFNFLSKNLPAFALDVSGDSFKIMQMAKKGASLEIMAYSNTPLGKGLVVNDELADLKTFEFLLKQALDKPQFGRVNSNYVIASLPESKSFVRVIQVPRMSESEAQNAVPYEAESFIPLPLDQVYLDWQKIGDKADSSRLGGQAEAGKMDILMIATPKSFVDKYLETLDKLGLKPVALEVESQSCHRALIPPLSTETVLIVDIDAFRTSLIMVEEGNLQFTSTVPIAGNAFTESIARILGVSSTKAEQIKLKVGIANTAEYPNIKISLLPVLNNLSSEIKNILKFHAEHSNKQVEKIILSGGGAKLNNLSEFLAPQLAEMGVAKVELANPWQILPQLKNPRLSPFEALSFITAIGLAVRGAQYEPK